MRIRAEKKGDQAAIATVNVSAFETPAEAQLVAALRQRAQPFVSLVAETDGEQDGAGGEGASKSSIVGHICFSPVVLPAHPALKIMGLAPMSVLPAHQRQGIGSALVRAGLEACIELGCGAVVVLGHPTYYPRFGFVPASRFAIDSIYGVPDDTFMALELTPGHLRGAAGTVRYHEVFDEQFPS